jgi:hypothetical protein
VITATVAVASAGCKTTLPRCDGGAAMAEEDKPGPRFLVVPQVRAEAFNVIESQWSPVNVTTELYFGGAPAGATVGYANLNGTSGFVMGASVLRYVRAPRLFLKDGWVGSIALPDFDGHMYFFLGEGDPTLVASFTTDLTGFRIAKCINPSVCFHGALRGPTIGPAIMMMQPYEVEPNDEPLGALVLGGSLDAGFAF